jgi:hypothetical protein
MNLAARMQLAVGARYLGSDDRGSAARERILRAGFWLPPTERPLARVLLLYPAVIALRAPTLNP